MTTGVISAVERTLRCDGRQISGIIQTMAINAATGVATARQCWRVDIASIPPFSASAVPAPSGLLRR
ncbi:MAG: hypothetical protein U0401_21150 [Anaerolineae bacterium]